MSYLVVLAPSPRGLRHYVIPGNDRSLCGIVVELWAIDRKGGKATCRRCMKSGKELTT